jgi:hypothetical protein
LANGLAIGTRFSFGEVCAADQWVAACWMKMQQNEQPLIPDRCFGSIFIRKEKQYDAGKSDLHGWP